MCYIIKIYTPQELNHSSYVQTGLFELERDAFLTTKVVLDVSKRLGTLNVDDKKVEETNQPHPKTSFYQLIDTHSGVQINFATDLYDASTSFSKYALEHCDYIFKRNYEKKYIDQLEPNFQNKIFPLGLTFRVQSNNKKQNYKFLVGLIFTNLRINSKFDSHFFSRLKKTYLQQIKHWKFAQTSRTIEEFDKQEFSTDDFILFQTRCFLNEDTLDLKRLHESRYEIIILLRNRFSTLFKGGFISSKIANQNYSDAITNLKTDPKSYFDLVKKSKIAIYTRGIQDSPAWKMAEYLSQGKVVIAEKINTELPVGLEHQKHVLFFENIDEIPLLCERVLNNTSLSEQLSKNGRLYYENVISPKVNIKRIIDFMLDHHNK